MTEHPLPNPYVGPRTFTAAEAGRFFGREREARDLLARVVSERLVLFYAQSGAGKSSLLQTRLIPQLQQDEGFAVLPVGRVSGDLPAGVTSVENIHVFNLLTSIDQSVEDPARLANLSLGEFLSHLVAEEKVDGAAEELHWRYDPSAEPLQPQPGEPAQRYALVIDQFEEIITAHPAHWHERTSFFEQLNKAMLDDSSLWVVLTLREDYTAALDPYSHLLADRLRARFYMERMAIPAALEAIYRPATLGGRPFDDAAAHTLVDRAQSRFYGFRQKWLNDASQVPILRQNWRF